MRKRCVKEVIMDYKVIDSCEWTYPDVWEYESEKSEYKGYALRGSYATFRLIVRDFSGVLKVSLDGADIYEEIAVPVEDNPNFEEGFMPHFPERVAPFSVYDCMKPYKDGIEKKHEVTSVYFALKTEDAPISSEIVLADGDGEIHVPVCVTPMGNMPEETLKIAMGYCPWNVGEYHKVDFPSEEFAHLDEKYLRLLRRGHQNRYFLDPVITSRNEKGEWKFDFAEFNARVKQLISLGFNGFHICGIGFRRAWDAPDIIVHGMDGLSFEAYDYLSQYLPALRENLRKNGWLESDMFCIGVADEPNISNALTYRAVSGMVRKFLPEIKIYDAVSYVPVYGAIDIWAPRADEFEKNREMFERFRADGDELWHYVCLYPRVGRYINRFMDIPLLATRYLYWANYKYNLSGYLHWSVNNYQSNIDPYEASCPVHINADSRSILPPGDDKLIYPGDGEPYMSARFEMQREAAEDYEMLRIISSHDKVRADAICEKCFRSFTDVEYGPVKFRTAHDELICEYAKYC